jgi:arabinan endo-1,5-alpha-L-arabinosidase
VHWRYAGDAFATRPDWVADTANLWAPHVDYFNGRYYLYYTAPDTDLPGGGSAIGVATAPTPTGPWTDAGAPVVEPQPTPGSADPNERRWVFDPYVLATPDGTRYLFYGSYFGGVSARVLSADGLHTDPATQVQIAIPNRYEGTWITYHDGWYYFFGSATNCCNRQLTGYSVFAARSRSPLGPYVDREGVSILAGPVGGTPVISMNGNRWVGPGHNAVFTDLAGQDWFLYHAVDRNDPSFAFDPQFTRRPVLLDRLDWVDGWPTVRNGRWASDTPQPAPAAQPGDPGAGPPPPAPTEPRIGRQVVRLSDDFSGSALDPGWSWVRQPDPSSYAVSAGALRWQVADTDLYVDINNAAVLTEPAPTAKRWMVEARVSVDWPLEGCCFNFVQGGLVVYGDDDNFVKLASVSIWETRQTEWAKEESGVSPGWARYGNTAVGPPGAWTWLRIVKGERQGAERYTAYTSLDGTNWVRGGTWTHHLGESARIGLVSMGGPGDFSTTFDYVHVYRMRTDG